MAEKRHLPNAPIVEAVIDLRVRFDRKVDFGELTALSKNFGETYVQKGAVFQGKVAFSFGNDSSFALQPSNTEKLGIRFQSLDDKYVAIPGVDGFTMARLAPYESWDNLLAEAMKLWEIYAQQLGPSQVLRAATRYVNNLRLPMRDGDSFNKYLVKFLEVPDALPQAVAEFVSRYVLVDRDSGHQAIVSLAYHPQPNTDNVTVILDIDAFALGNFSVSPDNIRKTLCSLRDLKNRVFFGALTDESLELYA